MSKKNKNFIILLVILSIITIVLGILTKKWGFLVNFLSAIGTIGAVIIVLYEKNEGPKIKIYTHYTLHDEVENPNHHYDDNNNYVHSIVTRVIENNTKKLDIYLSNEGAVNALIIELNFVSDKGKLKIKLNEQPLIIKSMDVVNINEEHNFLEYHEFFENSENVPNDNVLKTRKLFKTLEKDIKPTTYIEAKLSTGIIVKSDKIVLNGQTKYHEGDKI